MSGCKKNVKISEGEICKMKKRLPILFAMIIISCTAACGSESEKYISPGGENKITVKYDLVGRPKVIHNKKCVWEYSGSGFNEEPLWKVEWIDEDSFKLIYKDVSHNGKFSEEYEINLE